MKLIPMEYKTEYIFTEQGESAVEFDYINGTMTLAKEYIIESEKKLRLEKFRIPLRRREKVSDGILFGRYEVIVKYLNVIVIQYRDNYGNIRRLFLCDSKSLFLHLMDAFQTTFQYDEDLERVGRLSSNLREFVNEVKEKYNEKREFLTWIISVLVDENSDGYGLLTEPKKTKYDESWTELDLPFDIVQIAREKDFEGGNVCLDSSKCFVIENLDFDELYRKIELLLPRNIERVRSEEEKKKVISIYGENFENKEDVFSKDLSINERSITEQVANVENEIKRWEERLEKKLIEENWTQKYIELLSEKMQRLEDKYYKYINKNLEDKYGLLPNMKKELLEKIKFIQSSNYDEGINLHHEYCSILKHLEKQFSESLFQGEELKLSQYVEFYYWGSIFISNHLNKLNKHSLKNKQIKKEEIDGAMMYFYETATPEQAEELRKKEIYIENRKNGELGEKVVDYALKWLDESYIVVPKKQNSKYGQEVIIIYNPEFIDEKQEYDHIVIGKQGVFLIETKNYAGELTIDANGNWIRIKKDGTREGEMNPLQQVRRHEKLLKSIMNKDIPVIGLVCMSNPKLIIEGMENSLIPIVKSDLLVEFIEKYPVTNRELSRSEMMGCLNCIEDYMV